MSTIRASKLPHRLRPRHMGGAALLGGGVLLLSIGLATTLGSRWLVQGLLSRALGTSAITIESTDGGVVRALTLRNIAIHDAAQLGGGTLLIGRVEGHPLRGFVLSDIELRDLDRWPIGTRLRIQSLTTGFPPGVHTLRHIDNGRLQLPDADPITWSARQDSDHLVAKVFAKSLDLHEMTAATTGSSVPKLKGVLQECDFRVMREGTQESMRLTGSFHVRDLAYKALTFQGAPGILDASVRWGGLAPHVVGRLTLSKGQLRLHRTTLNLVRCVMTWTGDPATPALDLRGSARVGDTGIDLVLTGSVDAPNMELSSNPPLPEERLLFMLVTGREWKGADELATRGEVSPELARDAMGYFLSGKLPKLSAERLGITDISLIYRPETHTKGVGVTIRDKFKARYEMDRPTQTTADEPVGTSAVRAPTIHRVGADYQLTEADMIGVEAQTEVLVADPAETPEDETTTNNEVRVKYRREF